jgi:hypothetical protein
LDFDQQESSAPCGIYPSFAFINNDAEVLIWVKGGKFARLGTQQLPPIALHSFGAHFSDAIGVLTSKVILSRYRINLATGQATDVPFTINVELPVADTVRTSVDLTETYLFPPTQLQNSFLLLQLFIFILLLLLSQ